MGLKAAAQALKKAELLKDKVQQCKDLLNDNDAWVCQQQLQKIYQKVLILDLEYALDRKVEQELWNLGFKNYIATLQSQAKDRRNPKRGESQAMLSWCLEAASGFYLTLLQEICTAFDLDLPFRRKGYVYGCTSPWKAVEKLSAPHKSSCFYACQYCLVHLGDIARYRNQNKQAELFYRHAVSLSPSSGQPYNQLALLEASRDDKLSTVFLYVRSVAVKHPFQVATTNLAKTLSTALNDHTFNLEKHEKDGSKLTSQEYIIVFLKFHAVLHNLGDLNVATSYVKILTESLTALIATESFTSWKLVQMLVINLFALQHHCATGNKDEISFDEQQLSVDEKIARDSILDLIAGSLSALLLPVYTIKSSIVDYFALPSIKLCLDWIVSRKGKVLEQVAFTSRLQIWPSLCVLLNALQDCVVEFKHEQHIKTPLPEDCNLQGFLPLEKTFENLRFTNTELEGDTTTVNKLRAVRIIQLGHQIAQYRLNDANSSVLISIITDEKNEVEKKFVAMSGDVGPSNELMKELEELSLNKEKHGSIANSESPVPSESTSSKASSEPDPENLLEKKVGGILKPQGSLERNRNEIPTLNMETVPQESATPALSTPAFSTTRKARQNVAMQAIMRRAEAEQKQVTFKNLSPPVIPEEEESNDEKKIIANSTIALATNGTQASSTALPNKIPTQISVAQQQRPTIPTLSNNSTMNLQGLIKQGLNSNQMNSSSAASGQLFASPPSVEHEMLPYRQLQNCIYPPQTSGFNAQNPQFAKNFLSSQPQTQRYQQQTQRQFPSMNSIGTRALHARNFNQEGANSILQKSNDSKVNLQSGNTFNQGIISNLALNPNNGNAGRVLPNDMAQNLSLIQQNYQQQRINQNNAATLSPNSFQMTPTNMANFKINNFPQNYSSQQEKILISPSSAVATAAAPAAATAATNYPRNSVGQFNNSFNGQQSNSLNYAIFPNYESGDFNLWKDTQQQPPQPPITWWGNTNTTGTQQIRGTPLENRSQIRPNNEWGSNSRPGGVGTAITGGVGGVNINAGNSFQNTIHRQQHFRNSFDDVGLRFEVDQQQQLQPKPQTLQSTNTYSLFSGGANTWGNNCGNSSSQTSNVTQEQLKNRLSQQSLWSGPGPSPLERLLEQQKSLREGGT